MNIQYILWYLAYTVIMIILYGKIRSGDVFAIVWWVVAMKMPSLLMWMKSNGVEKSKEIVS